MAEYTGLILALLLAALNKTEHIRIRCDSALMVKQVKGMNVVRNVRLVYVVPIVHDLIKHFKSVQLDWIPREMNQVADSVARDTVKYNVGRSHAQPDLFKIKF